MKNIFLATISAVALTTGAVAQTQPAGGVRGHITDTNGESLAYCTIMFAPTSDTLNIKGDITNAAGFFEMALPAGEYRFDAVMMGYERHRRVVTVGSRTDLGTIVLNESATQVEAVVVTPEMIHRKADGYMFLPTGSVIATGRNTRELLGYAPGVWVDRERGISVNGRSGTRVMVNDRLLNLSHEELMTYLEGIDAGQIRSIEVIPDAGAQYDADSAGGILKITLKRTMNGGLSGSLNVSYRFHDDSYPYRFQPSASLEYRKNRLSVYTNFSYNRGRNLEVDEETTRYDDGRAIDGMLDYKAPYSGGYFRVGSVYELTDRQSVGVDFDYIHGTNSSDGHSYGTIDFGDYRANTDSRYGNDRDDDRYNISLNYRLKTDEKGSALTLMADYMRNNGTLLENNHTVETPVDAAARESNRTIDQSIGTDYYTARLDYKHYLNQKIQLEAGAKYAYTEMDTRIDNTELLDGVWAPIDELNDHYLYREGVLAGYINGSASLGRWNLTAGLRVENTDLRPYSYVRPGETRDQNYTDFFPSASAMWFIDREKGHMLTLSYTRRIGRPGFSMLNPFRIQVNNYTFIVGNPDLTPSYANNYTLTGVLANKYSLSVGISDRRDYIENRVVITDPDDPDVLLFHPDNVDRGTMYYVTANAPVNIFKWWRANLYVMGGYTANKLRGYENSGWMGQGQLQNLFSLPRSWSVEATYMHIAGLRRGNMAIKGPGRINMSVKKGLFDGKLNASLFVDNVLNGKNDWPFTATVTEPGNFTKTLRGRNSDEPTRRYGVALSWNFRTGKDTRQVQKVTAGNEEERNR